MRHRQKHLIPVRSCVARPGRFQWSDKVVLATPTSADLLPLGQLRDVLKQQIGTRARIVRNALGPSALRIFRDPSIHATESYRISIAKEGISLFAGTDAAAYYAVQTLCELIRLHGKALPACEIRDSPDLARRAVYLDCSRGKVPAVTTVKRLVEQLSRWKINELQMYIENVFTFRQHPTIGRGFSAYTPEELLEIQDHCRLYHVDFVPSLTSFGHFERILSLPAYRHLGELPGHYALPGGTTLCPGDPGSIKLVADMYAEFLPLFESVNFNACCDETWELGKGRSKRRVDRIGTGRVYLAFIKQLHRLCEKHGKRMNIWSDIVLNHPDCIPDVPENTVMLNWDYSPDGSRIPRTGAFAKAGLPFMVCPGTSDWQSHGTHLPNAIRNVAVFAAAARKHGAEGMLNTEWGDAGHRNPLGVNMHGYAHGAAHAWNGCGVDDKSFTRTFAFHFLGQNDARLGDAITTLGVTETRVGRSMAYHGLVQSLLPDTHLFKGVPKISPVWRPPAHRRDYVDAADEAGCRETIAQLKTIRWDRFDVGKNPFVRETLADLTLAAFMDELACRRILAGKAIRGAKTPSSKALRTLAADTQACAREFKANWMKRNRPSRLRDNLTLFENAAKESLALANR